MRLILVILLLSSCTSTAKDLPLPEPRTIFTARSTLDYVHQAVKVANCVIVNEKFLSEIGKFAKYDYTTMKPAEVEARIRGVSPAAVSTYRTTNPFSRVIATTYSTDPTTIYLNTRNNPQAMPDMVNTIIHELTHLNNFGHGDNSPVGKDNSVPYRLGSMAEKYVSECSK
jgi:hypothetical protein